MLQQFPPKKISGNFAVTTALVFSIFCSISLMQQNQLIPEEVSCGEGKISAGNTIHPYQVQRWFNKHSGAQSAVLINFTVKSTDG